jgi:hypothetical protein
MRIMNPRLLLAWAVTLILAYFALGFLANFYSASLEVAIVSLLVQCVLGTFMYFLLGRAWDMVRDRHKDFPVAVALFTVLAIFVMGTFGMAAQFPSLFEAEYFLLSADRFGVFMIGALLALPCLLWGIPFAKHRGIAQTRFFHFVDENLPGMMLAGFFFALYLITVSIFNRPAFDVDDIFFDSDGLLWRMRFVTADYRDYYWRAVHPFVLLIIRPLVALIALFLKGDRLSAAFVLVAFAGAVCVFLAWKFVKRTNGNSLYALLIGSMLGASAAHLVFASLIETYIFLAAVTLIFLLLLLEEKPLIALILTGLVSFGITITNFIQTAIAFIVLKRDFKGWVKYALIVAALTVPLTLLNNVVYPDSQPYFFVPSSFSAEADNTFAPSLGRALAIGRVMFLHSVVAPDPLILEEEIPFLKVWISKAETLQVSEYETLLGTCTAFFWLGLMVIGGTLFVKNLKNTDQRFPLAFILILLFNFVLHLRYGKDLFLYSANWTYAIILLLSIAWRELSGKRWFQIVLLLFIALEIVNNSRLIQTMLSTSALHIR